MQNNLFEFRKARGMSQMELARKSGVSRTTIWQIETNPDYAAKKSVLEALAHALGVTVSELLISLPDAIRLNGRYELTENGEGYLGGSFFDANHLMQILEKYGKDATQITVLIERKPELTGDADGNCGDGA